MPHCELSVIDYSQRMDEWFAALLKDTMRPAQEDAEILRAIMKRVLDEFQLEKEGCDLPRAHANRQVREEPMRGFIHGPPGTGKSRLIYWIRRLFTEALGWEHGKQFLCVAFQNRVAHAMGGVQAPLNPPPFWEPFPTPPPELPVLPLAFPFPFGG